MGEESWEERELWLQSENDEDLYDERESLSGSCDFAEAEEYWQRVRDENLANYGPGQMEANRIAVDDFDRAIAQLATQLVSGEI